MEKKVPPRVQFDFQEEIDEETGEENPNFKYEDEEEDFESYEDEINAKMPDVVEKPKPVKEDIFDLPNLAVKPDYLEIGDPPEVPPVEATPKPAKQKKPRKPMSEEHKAKLAQARQKALAVRKAKAQERKQMKEVETKTKQLRQKKKIKEMQELEEEVNESIPPPKKTVVNQPVSNLTKKDLEDAQFEAINKYETLRKARKEEKRKKQAIEKSKQDLVDKLKPTGYRYRDGSNRWDACY
jgi:uncharacterized protein with von Willebrand factor type A (vWA) domain